MTREAGNIGVNMTFDAWWVETAICTDNPHDMAEAAWKAATEAERARTLKMMDALEPPAGVPVAPNFYQISMKLLRQGVEDTEEAQQGA
jgi:hypothetical protein